MTVTIDATLIALVGGGSATIIAAALFIGRAFQRIDELEDTDTKQGGQMKEMENRLKSELSLLEERVSREKDSAVAKHCEDIDDVMARLLEHKSHNDKQHDELYLSRNNSEKIMTSLQDAMSRMDTSFDEMKGDLKEFMKEMRERVYAPKDSTI